MKVVLVIPPYDAAKAFGYSMLKPRGGNLPMLGVGYLAAAVKARGHEVVLVDAMAGGLGFEAALAAVSAASPGVMGISCLSFRSAPGAYEMARRLRDAFPDVPLVIGGPHVTDDPEEVLRDCPAIDVAVPGEGETIFADLVDALAAGQRWEAMDGILHRNADGEIVATAKRSCVRDLDEVAFPDRSIYDRELYSPLPNLGMDTRLPTTVMAVSRGCAWGRCTFCSRGGRYASPYRRRSPENVVDEIRAMVQEYGVRNIKFLDDNFCVDEAWLDGFCGLLEESGLGVKWAVLARVDTVSRATLHRMARAGCTSVQYGIESGNQELLDLVKKGITLDEIRNAVRWANEAGLSVMATIMIGLPTETPEMSRKTIRFACQLGVDYLHFWPFGLMAQTRIEEVALREGRLMPTSDEDIYQSNYVPQTYESREAVTRMVRYAYLRYYLRPSFILRVLAKSARNPLLFKNYFAAFRYWVDMMMTGVAGRFRSRAE